MILVLIRFWLCRGGSKGRKAWERSGGLGEVPGDPSHHSIGAHNVQVLGNRVCSLLQDVYRGSYRKLEISTGRLLTSTGSLLTPTGSSTVDVLGDGGVYGWMVGWEGSWWWVRNRDMRQRRSVESWLVDRRGEAIKSQGNGATWPIEGKWSEQRLN